MTNNGYKQRVTFIGYCTLVSSAWTASSFNVQKPHLLRSGRLLPAVRSSVTSGGENEPALPSRRAALLSIACALATIPCDSASASPVPAGVGIRGADPNGPTYALPPLPYGSAALEPYFGKELVDTLHDKIHAEYVTTLNEAYQGKKAPVAIANLQQQAKSMPADVRRAAGGHYNHCLFFASLAPEADAAAPSAVLGKTLDQAFGSDDGFMASFKKAAEEAVGNGGGWVWLGVAPTGNKLVLTTTKGEDNPLMEGTCFPFLCLDCNKRAYESQFGDDVGAYASAFFNVINWRRVSANYVQFSTNKAPVPCVQGDLLAAPPASFK